MTVREIDGFCTDCGNWTPLHNGRCGCGSGRVACPPAGYVILPAAEVERTAQRAWVLAKGGATADQIAAIIRALKGAKP